MKIDLDMARNTYRADMANLIAEYGNASSIPGDDQRVAAERLRAAYAIDINPDMPLPQVMRVYSIDSRVWSFFIENAEELQSERRLSRADKQLKVLSWAAVNVGVKVDLTKLMEVGDVAYSMAKKITEDRPDVFRKIKRGEFEVRNPEADRKADKEAAEKKDS